MHPGQPVPAVHGLHASALAPCRRDLHSHQWQLPLFISSRVTNGSGLAVEFAGCVAGLLGGLAAAALMRVYRSPSTGRPVSSAGAPYAIFWVALVGARAAFSYGAAHWFTAPIVDWAIANRVTEAAMTDGLIFMAVVMILVRTAGLGARASRLPTSTRDPAPTPAVN